MLSQTMLFSFPFVFVRLSLDLLILTYLVMGMINSAKLSLMHTTVTSKGSTMKRFASQFLKFRTTKQLPLKLSYILWCFAHEQNKLKIIYRRR